MYLLLSPGRILSFIEDSSYFIATFLFQQKLVSPVSERCAPFWNWICTDAQPDLLLQDLNWLNYFQLKLSQSLLDPVSHFMSVLSKLLRLFALLRATATTTLAAIATNTPACSTCFTSTRHVIILEQSKIFAIIVDAVRSVFRRTTIASTYFWNKAPNLCYNLDLFTCLCRLNTFVGCRQAIKQKMLSYIWHLTRRFQLKLW